MTDLVERLVPDELWALFRRAVPPTEVVRPQGCGKRRAGDRECLAAIIFVATSGCTWRQLPPVFGRPGPPFTGASPSGARPGCGPGSTGSSSTNSVRGASWTGRGARSIRSASGRQKGASDRTESARPWQERIENPPHHRPERVGAAAPRTAPGCAVPRPAPTPPCLNPRPRS